MVDLRPSRATIPALRPVTLAVIPAQAYYCPGYFLPLDELLPLRAGEGIFFALPSRAAGSLPRTLFADFRCKLLTGVNHYSGQQWTQAGIQ